MMVCSKVSKIVISKKRTTILDEKRNAMTNLMPSFIRFTVPATRPLQLLLRISDYQTTLEFCGIPVYRRHRREWRQWRTSRGKQEVPMTLNSILGGGDPEVIDKKMAFLKETGLFKEW